jgi:hypothetical protein
MDIEDFIQDPNCAGGCSQDIFSLHARGGKKRDSWRRPLVIIFLFFFIQKRLNEPFHRRG